MMNKDEILDEDCLKLLSQWNEIFSSEFKYTLDEILKESECNRKIPSVSGYSAHEIFYDLHGDIYIRLLHFSSEDSELFTICKDWFQFWHNISGDKEGLLVTKKKRPAPISLNGSYLEAFSEIDKVVRGNFSKNLFSFENSIYNESMNFGLKKDKADIEDFISRFEQNQKEKANGS